MPKIGRVVFPDFRRDAQFRAQESGSQFGNQFLTGIAGIAETLRAEIPVKAVLRSDAPQWRSAPIRMSRSIRARRAAGDAGRVTEHPLIRSTAWQFPAGTP
jgi:hypothetical protein